MKSLYNRSSVTNEALKEADLQKDDFER